MERSMVGQPSLEPRFNVARIQGHYKRSTIPEAIRESELTTELRREQTTG